MARIGISFAGKLVALSLFVAIVSVLAVYLGLRGKGPGETSYRPKLESKVVAVFNNARYAHESAGRVRFVLTAGTDKTYQDSTHELEQVRLESYGQDGRVDLVTADRAHISDTSDLNRLDAEFSSNVVVNTSEGLSIKTNYLVYHQDENRVETNEPVDFEYKNVQGRSTGVVVETELERARLLKDVNVLIKPGAASDSPKDETRPKKTKKKSDQLQPAKKEPTTINAAAALLEKKERRMTFSGGATVKQGSDQLSGSQITAYLNEADRLEKIEVRGNAILKKAGSTEIESRDIDFFFGDQQKLVKAVATGGAHVRSLDAEPSQDARAESIEAEFAEGPAGTAISRLKASSNASIEVHPTKDNLNERRLAAGTIRAEFYSDGKNIRVADAVDNAVLTVIPVRSGRGIDKKTIQAPRMSASFFEERNQMKSFTAVNGVRVDIEATVAEDHPVRTTVSKTLTAVFSRETQDIDRIEQAGDFKYTEGDRNATADRAFYDAGSEFLTLRGNRPTGWDSKARTQANEIDLDRKNDETHARGDVRTTYYSPEKTNDSTPFQNSKAPVFMTAERADAKNADGIAVYTGNARGWQEDNFIRADRIELYDKQKRMLAIGGVESALYSTKRETSQGTREVVPGFATSDRMLYSDPERLVRYEGNVKVRQGTDRLDAKEVEVYLKPGNNEVDQLKARGSVVMVQPGRRGVGDQLDYTSDDDKAILIGRSARIDDEEKGSIMGAQLTFYGRDDKVFAENRNGTGRIRSTHRLTKNKEKR